MKRSIRAAVAVFAGALAIGVLAVGCAHDNGNHTGQDRSAYDSANDSATSAARNAGQGARQVFDEANDAATDFFEGLQDRK